MKNRWLVWSIVGVAFGLILVVLIPIPWLRHYQWEEALKQESPAIRAAAIRGLPRQGNEQLLITALMDENPDVRLLATQRLGYPGPKGAERAWALICLLKDGHAGVRREAAWSLGLIGPEGWPALREALTDESPRVRAGAALALGDAFQPMAPEPWPSRESKAIIPVLSKLLSDTEPEVHHNTKRALDYVLRFARQPGAGP